MSPSVSVRLLLTQSDARLAQYAGAGHERAFEALVHRYRRRLHAYCRRLLLSDERAEDALQQALLQAWMALSDGTEVREVRPWLYRIVHNAAINALRVSGYDYCQLSESLTGAGAPQEDLDRRIAVREALAGLAALPQMQREALLSTAVEGRSHQQVAGDLGVSEPALRGLVYRARAALRAAAGAILPPPVLSWALEAGGRGTPALERAVAIGGGSGSAGLAGLLVKSGAVAVTASAVAGGLVAKRDHMSQARAAPPAARTHFAVSAGAASRAGAPAQPAAFKRPADRAAPTTTPARRAARPLDRDAHRAQPIHMHAPRPLTPPLAPALTWTPDSHGNGDGRDLQAGGQRASLGSHEGGSDGSARDGHGDGFGGSGPGSPWDRQQKDDGGGGGGTREGAVTGLGQDGFGTPAAPASSGDEPGGGDGGSASGGGRQDGSRDAQPSESGSGGPGRRG